MPPKKQNKRSNGRQTQPKRRAQSGPRRDILSSALAGLDNGARAFRNLLLDPCNAPMVGPAYGGIHSGNYRRFRRIYSIPAAEVETVFVWQPGTNTLWQGGHSAGSAGTDTTFVGQAAFSGSSFHPDLEGRCLSACAKVRYVGAESARAGTVALATGSYFFAPVGTPGGGPSALEATSVCPMVGRLGETTHEVKFVPLAGDEEMTQQSVVGVALFPLPQKSCILVSLRGVPAGSVQIELTAVLEIDNFDNGTSGNTSVATAVAPASGNTLNQVLRTLGPVTNWAFHHVAVPTIRAISTGLSSTVGTTAAAMSTGMRLLTL